MIHGPSLGIGAGIATVAIIAAFFVFDYANQPEKELEPAAQTGPIPTTTLPPTTESEKTGPSPITSSVFLDNASPILGNPNAPVTLVEFGDYQCYFCNQFFHNTENELLKNYVETGKVKMIFKDFTIIGPDSILAAHAAHCAEDQGLFWEYHDILYDNWNGENNGWAASENLLKFSQEVGLDIDEFSNCMVDATHQDSIAASNQDARTLGLTGTPAFFVIGPDNQVTKIGGAQPYEVFERIFDSELKK